MTATKNDTNSTPPLAWTGKKQWGSVGNTYIAHTSDGWKYAVDQPRKGFWQLRGWGPDGLFLYREDTTMKGCKAQAADHVKDRAAAAAEAARVMTELAAAPPVVPVDEGAQVLADAGRLAGPAAAAMLRLTAALNVPQPCGCKTPLHTMRCGAGGRATVVRATCTECFRINHKLDCSKGRAA